MSAHDDGGASPTLAALSLTPAAAAATGGSTTVLASDYQTRGMSTVPVARFDPTPPVAIPAEEQEASPNTAAAEIAEAETDPQFAALLASILLAVPDDATLRDPLRAGLARHWLRPPMTAMQLSLADPTLTESDARRCLFLPTVEDMQLRYPRLILSPPGVVEGIQSHPQRLAQAPALTLLYFTHQHSWTLVKPFVLGGGFIALTGLLVDTNLDVRAQAVEVTHRITNGYGEQFDWWQPPGEELPAHERMAELAQTAFLRNLLINLKTDEASQPGSFLCLQIIAFWLSYIRQKWTQDGILHLSQETLDALHAHAQRQDLEAAEAALATELHTDFSRWPPLEVAVASSPTKAAAAAPANAAPTSEILKEQGNALFKAGSWAPAVALYTAAIDLAKEDPANAARVAVYYSNRSAAHVKLWESPTLSHNDRITHLTRCLEDCDAAVKADPTYLKGHFRKASILHDVASSTDNLHRKAEYLTAAAGAISDALRLAAKDEGVNELADKIQAALRATTDGLEVMYAKK